MASRTDLGMRGEKDKRRKWTEIQEQSQENLGTGKGSWRLKRFRVRGWSEKC